MESLRSTHARLAALIRHRGEDDPEVAAARAELARSLAETQTVRDRLASLPPATRARLLDALALEDEGATAA